MTLSLAQFNAVEFQEMVHQEFRPKFPDFKKYCTVKAGVRGKAAEFPVLGSAIATERSNQYAPVEYQEVSNRTVLITPKEYTVYVPVSKLLSGQVPFDTRKEYAAIVADALFRRGKQLVIDAVAASGSFAGDVPNTISGSAAGLTVAALRESRKFLNRNAVPKEKRVFMAHSDGETQLLESTQITSSDFNSVQALTRGDVGSFLGFEFDWIPDMPEGGLPIPAAGQAYAYAWSQGVVGMAINMEPEVIVERNPDKDCDQAVGRLIAQVSVLDPRGLVRINHLRP
jgi:hypothetical protein